MSKSSNWLLCLLLVDVILIIFILIPKFLLWSNPELVGIVQAISGIIALLIPLISYLFFVPPSQKNLSQFLQDTSHFLEGNFPRFPLQIIIPLMTGFLVALSFLKLPNPNPTEPKISLSLYQDRVYDQPSSEESPVSFQEKTPFDIEYNSKEDDEKLMITPSVEYFSNLEHEGITENFNGFVNSYSEQIFPELSIHVSNPTDSKLTLSEVNIKVESTSINREPVLIIPYNQPEYANSSFILFNEGWTKIVNPVFDFNFVKGSFVGENFICNASIENESQDYLIKNLAKNSFEKQINISIADYVPVDLKQEKGLCVIGRIRYETDKGIQMTTKFKTPVFLIPSGAIYYPVYGFPNHCYDLQLETDKVSYTAIRNISQTIEPGDQDRFLISIAADKSAIFDLDITFQTVDGTKIHAGKVNLSIFVPRSVAEGGAEQSQQKLCKIYNE